MLDENKWLAARHGLGGELVDLPDTAACRCRELARRLVDRLRAHAEELGSREELEGIEDLLENGNGGVAPGRGLRGQPRPARGRGEIVAATVPEEADIPQE